MLGPFLSILYAYEMFELVENRLFTYADDSTLFSDVVSQPTDLLDLATSVIRDMVHIHE